MGKGGAGGGGWRGMGYICEFVYEEEGGGLLTALVVKLLTRKIATVIY